MITTISDFFERDIKKLIEEVKSFRNQDNLWKVQGDVKNSAGNLALHIIGGTNHHIGAVLGKTGYMRDRDSEFSAKYIQKDVLITELEKLILIVKSTLSALNDDDLGKEHPRFFDKEGATIGYVLTQLLLHLNYHLGEVNYLRRILEPM